MALMDEMGVQGSWLFRWRSFVPLALLALLLPPSLATLHLPFGSHHFHVVWEWACFAISMLGLAIRCATVGFVPVDTSGRGTTKLRAGTLNTSGMYSLVRHPLYLGNYVAGLGVTLVWFEWWAPVIYSLCFWLYYERIMLAEERYLASQFGDEFQRWAASTPPFLPRPAQFARWKSPSLPFSLVSTIRREYSTFVLLVTLHAGMEAIENFWLDGRLSFGMEWGGFLAGSLVVYLLMGLLKKRTRLLQAKGR